MPVVFQDQINRILISEIPAWRVKFLMVNKNSDQQHRCRSYNGKEVLIKPGVLKFQDKTQSRLNIDSFVVNSVKSA